MAHGFPDYGAAQAKAELYTGVDLAEVAARLGALSRYDRLGDVIFYEDFGGDLGALEVEDSGAGETAVVTADRKVIGSFSCRLTSAGVPGSYIGLLGRFPVPYSVMYGVEIQWTWHANMDHAYFRADIYTGAYHLAFGIQLDVPTGLNYYLNALGGWTAIPGAIFPYFDDRMFNVAKFTFNIATMRYSRFLIPPRLIDLSACIGFAVADLVTRPHMECSGRIYDNGAAITVSYVDSLIITANDM